MLSCAGEQYIIAVHYIPILLYLRTTGQLPTFAGICRVLTIALSYLYTSVSELAIRIDPYHCTNTDQSSRLQYRSSTGVLVSTPPYIVVCPNMNSAAESPPRNIPNQLLLSTALSSSCHTLSRAGPGPRLPRVGRYYACETYPFTRVSAGRPSRHCTPS